MSTIASGLNTEFKSHLAVIQSQCYLANDFDAMKVWDGIASAASSAGMAAPASAPSSPSVGSGNVTAGVHLIRYRYYNSQTLYVSNPSPSLSYTSGASALTFTVGTHLVASADAKCDKIILESTSAGGTAYYRVGYVANTAAQSIIYNVSDNVLIQGDSVSALTGDFGHEQPPLFALMASHRGRLFGAGTTTRTRSVGVTSGSTAVTGTSFSLQWAGRRIRFGTEGISYEIASVSSATAMTLSTNYVGSSTTLSAAIYSGTPNRLFWTTALYPEGWKPSAYARDMLNNKSDELRGLITYSGDLFVFGRHSSERLVFTSDPGTAEGQVVPVPGDRGVLNQNCLIEADGVLYSWDRQGMYIAGQRPQHVSKPIDRTLVDYVDFDQVDDFHGVFDPADRVLMWFFTAIGDTEPHYAACMELDGGRWSLAYFQQGITASHIVPDSEGQVRAMLGDVNGYTWFYGIEGGWDGLPTNAPSVVTITGSPTATSIPVTETLPTSPDMAGVVIVNPLNDETAVISSNSSSTLTLAGSGFTTVPTAGGTLYCGAIPWEYESKWFTLGGDDMSPVYLKMHVHPSTATGKCRIYVYKNWSDTPETLTRITGDVFPDGTTVGDGVVTSANYMTVDLDGGDGDGVLMVPLPCDWAKHWKARLVCDKPDGEIRLLDLAFTYDVGKKAAEV